jgi:YHYH protein
MKFMYIWLVSAIVITGCGGGGSSDSTTTDSTGSQTDDNDTATASSDTWVINTQNTRSNHIFERGSNLGTLVNVQSVAQLSVDGVDYTYLEATGIPDYAVTLTQDMLDWLNGRPKASTDFATGFPSASVNEVIEFAQDIGYSSGSCDGGGYGYWPPGPVCPDNQSHQAYIPNSPREEIADKCETGLGNQGYWVNGTSIYNWGDGQSYNNSGVWQTLAPEAEYYDVDICGGHAANGDYHHHFYSQCLADLVGDTGEAHSPIYGFAADGYAIYGPWHADGVLAKSSWLARDYSAGSATGCGTDGVRSCVLVDSLDPSQGTQSAGTTGPSTSDTYTSLSGNIFNAESGFFFEDYYWDSSVSGDDALDQYNGHSDADRGYHYHVTITEDSDGDLKPAFPYTVGVELYGSIEENVSVNCGGAGGGGFLPPR